MSQVSTNYQRPEIVEIGPATELTLGDALQPCKDNCGCKQPKDEVELEF